MTYLLENAILGRLELIEVYEEYDGPRLFSCRNSSGQIYLAIWVEKKSDKDIWIYLPISAKRFTSIRSGDIDLREAFLTAEDGYIFIVNISKLNGHISVDERLSREIDNKWLPEQGEFLNLTTVTLPPIEDDINKIAVSRRRDIIHLILKIPNITRSEVPARILGNFLKFIQETIDAIGYACESTDKTRGPIPISYISKTQLSVTRTFAGSFGVELSSLKGADLFGNTPTGRAIEQFISLLNIGCEADQLKEMFSNLRIRPAIKYRELLNHI